MSSMFMQAIFFFMILLVLAVPLGWYIKEVMQGKVPKGMAWLQPIEKASYKVIGQSSRKEMTAKTYFLHIVAISLISIIGLTSLLMSQHWLPLGEAVKNMPLFLAFNTAVSFVTNTNWQAYSGELALSNFSQSLGLTVQNFLSAAVGIAVLFALLRGMSQKLKRTIGNVWQDITRALVYILFPLSMLFSIVFMSQGVGQTLSRGVKFIGLDGQAGFLPLGPVASQLAIKQLGTNGGGFFGANSAHPFENPTIFSNFAENIAILLIPAALIFAFGFWIKDWKQGRTILIASTIFLALAFIGVLLSEAYGPQFAHVLGQANMEGKEVRFGVGWSSIWTVSTTAASNGSVNAMLDSFTPLGGALAMFLMQLGEIIFGGVGSGLYGMLAFLLLTVFVAGLLVGRTPEYIGKKIEAFDIKMVSVVILLPLLTTLFGAFLLSIHPGVLGWMTNQGPHGFSELLYTATSLANNNGSAFSGFTADTTFLNGLGALMMLLARFVPMFAILLLAENMGGKKKMALSEGTLSTVSPVFITMLVLVILVIGALSFLPAMALGPIAEFFTIK